MDLSFELGFLTASRTKLLNLVNGLTEEELFFIPNGCHNNILWHTGHCVASQQRLVYLRSNLPLRISDDYAANFKIGSSPAIWTTKPDVNEIKDSLLGTVDQLKDDIANNIFTHYEPMRTSMGFTLHNYVEAVCYANLHEAEHIGNIHYMLKMMGK
jgi:hypothetical protein